MPDPIWLLIAEDLQLKIESGELGRDGKPLPTELELQEAYRASRHTVREAIKWLAHHMDHPLFLCVVDKAQSLISYPFTV